MLIVSKTCSLHYRMRLWGRGGARSAARGRWGSCEYFCPFPHTSFHGQSSRGSVARMAGAARTGKAIRSKPLLRSGRCNSRSSIALLRVRCPLADGSLLTGCAITWRSAN